MHTVPTRPEWLTGGNMYMNHELETCVTYPSKTKHVHMFSFFQLQLCTEGLSPGPVVAKWREQSKQLFTQEENCIA